MVVLVNLLQRRRTLATTTAGLVWKSAAAVTATATRQRRQASWRTNRTTDAAAAAAAAASDNTAVAPSSSSSYSEAVLRYSSVSVAASAARAAPPRIRTLPQKNLRTAGSAAAAALVNSRAFSTHRSDDKDETGTPSTAVPPPAPSAATTAPLALNDNELGAADETTTIPTTKTEHFPSSAAAIAAAAAAAALERALRLSPDPEWDALVVDYTRHNSYYDSGGGGGTTAADDDDDMDDAAAAATTANNNNNEPVETYDMLGPGRLVDSDGSSSTNGTSSNTITAAAPLSWSDRRWKIQTTAKLIDTAVGAWTVEDWFAAEDLLVQWLPRQGCLRSVILQFPLFHRTWQEKEHVLQQQTKNNIKNIEANTTTSFIGSSSSSESANETDAYFRWLNLKVLDHLIRNWKLVYFSHAAFLSDCHLAPTHVLGMVLNTYHGHFGMTLCDKIFYFIADAEVNHPRQGQTPEFVQRVLFHVIDLYRSGMSNCYPKTILWNTVIAAWVKAERGPATIDTVTKLLQHMDALKVPRSRITYYCALQAWAQQGSVEAAREAENLLQQMYTAYLEDARSTQPDVYSFCAVVDAWAKSKSPHAGPRAEQIYQQMVLLRKKDHLFGHVSNDTTLINCALQCWANAGTAEGVAKAEAFWRSTGVAASAVTYSALMSMYCQHGNIAAVERLWREMETAVDVEGNSIRAGTSTITALFTAYAKSKLPNKVELAEAVLQRMKESTDTKPNTISYNAFLTVLASVPKIASKQKAQDILREMKELSDAGAPTRPDFISYSTVMNGWAQQGHPEQASRLLREMYDDYLLGNETAKPDLQCFNAILTAYSKCKDEDAPRRAEAFLDHMKKIADDGVLDIRPDVYTMSSVLACLANTQFNRPEAAAKAEGILQSMRNSYKNSGDHRCRPNSYCYNSVIDAWSRTGLHPERSEAVFLQMCEDFRHGNESAKPQTVTFNILLKAWAFSKRSRAPERAEEILRQMQELTQSRSMNVPPDVRTYTTLVTCYGLSKQAGAPQRAQQIVRHMDELYKTGQIHEGPSQKTFQSLRKAWKYSYEPNKEEAVAAIEREMKVRFGKLTKN